MNQPLPIAVLISGRGTTLANIIDLARAGELPVDVRLVISSRPGAGGLRHAAEAGIPTAVIERLGHPEELFSKRVTEAVLDSGAELVCMGGFLHLWVIPPELEHRVMNVHPALLPLFGGKGFYGDRVHQAVLEAGCKVSGCTVHFADNRYDAGPIIAQRCVPVREDDTPATLGQRVRAAEQILYPEAIRLYATGRLKVQNGRVRILEAAP